jgi:hypothetical protein
MNKEFIEIIKSVNEIQISLAITNQTGYDKDIEVIKLNTMLLKEKIERLERLEKKTQSNEKEDTRENDYDSYGSEEDFNDHFMTSFTFD